MLKNPQIHVNAPIDTVRKGPIEPEAPAVNMADEQKIIRPAPDRF